jgi:methionine-S-sulfoxide reductase
MVHPEVYYRNRQAFSRSAAAFTLHDSGQTTGVIRFSARASDESVPNFLMKGFLPLLAVLGLICGTIQQTPGQTQPNTKTAVFAGGCFWCIQPAFDKVQGVIKTTVGYCGGTEPNPTYELVGSETTKYRESIEVVYDPQKVSYDQLLDVFWKQIDPTQADGQFTDIGPSYRAAIFYGTAEEKQKAEASKAKLAQSGMFKKSIVTEVLPAMKFYPAEGFHQKYYRENPERFDAFEQGSGRAGFKEKFWGKP